MTDETFEFEVVSHAPKGFPLREAFDASFNRLCTPTSVLTKLFEEKARRQVSRVIVAPVAPTVMRCRPGS